jgi:hypothetical protein
MNDKEKEKIFKTLCDDMMAQFKGREMNESLIKEMEAATVKLNEQMKELGIDLKLIVQYQNGDQN